MFHGGSGNSADGEGGDDTLVFSGNASDYTILGEATISPSVISVHPTLSSSPISST
ncbi:hypothetical protein [Brucella sp. 09RB8471]|uniref:hypothetical protein n=1 Tax=Brucella sp. 09RB8471 TaxID=1149952 RepID=UPI0012EC414C|nr:hypothetical protein [Brucella sp. 09RB8471]